MSVTESQRVAETLSESGFQVIVYGSEDDPDVRDIVSRGSGTALQLPDQDVELHKRKIVLLRQESMERGCFADFVSRFFAQNIGHIYELRVINTLPADGATDLNGDSGRRSNGG
jgi:hypothetical protein